MKEVLKIDNKTISTPLYDIILDIKKHIHNGKLKYIGKPKGDNIRVTCPHHNNGMEQKAASDIYIGETIPDKIEYGFFNCFVCGEKGPFYHFVAECFDKSDEWAKEWLIENYADGLIEYEEELPSFDIPKPKKTILPESTLDKYESWHPYMAKRKLSKEVVNNFQIKYDPESKCIVFPVRDICGRLVMLTRRSVVDKTYIIPPDVEKPIYLLDYLVKKNITEAYLCESQINALTLWTHGVPGIALFGTGSQHQYDILNHCGIRHYYLCFDGDAAGDKGIRNFLKNIRKDVTVDIIKVPRGKDINDLSYDEVEALITGEFINKN